MSCISAIKEPSSSRNRLLDGTSSVILSVGMALLVTGIFLMIQNQSIANALHERVSALPPQDTETQKAIADLFKLIKEESSSGQTLFYSGIGVSGLGVASILFFDRYYLQEKVTTPALKMFGISGDILLAALVLNIFATTICFSLFGTCGSYCEMWNQYELTHLAQEGDSFCTAICQNIDNEWTLLWITIGLNASALALGIIGAIVTSRATKQGERELNAIRGGSINAAS